MFTEHVVCPARVAPGLLACSGVITVQRTHLSVTDRYVPGIVHIITSSLLPETLGGRNDDLHFMEEENVASEWQIEDLNPGDFGCLSVDSCPGTGQVKIWRLQTSCHTKWQGHFLELA